MNCVFIPFDAEIQVGPKETLNLCIRLVEKPQSPDSDKEQLCFSNIVFQDKEVKCFPQFTVFFFITALHCLILFVTVPD